jgi:hypothetical protein
MQDLMDNQHYKRILDDSLVLFQHNRQDMNMQLYFQYFDTLNMVRKAMVDMDLG